MSPVTTSMNGANLKITWTSPSNGGSSISSYKINILQSDGTYSENTGYCDGSNFVIMGNLFCEIPMYVLTSSPYSLAQGTLI